jgi:hypothetical protein
MQRALFGMGVGAIVVGGAAAAWMLGRDAEHDHSSHDHGDHAGTDTGAPPTGTKVPPTANPDDVVGPANLAVAWWPQDISVERHGADATLRFQSTIVNLGGEAAPIRSGDRVEYSVHRLAPDGTAGELVASNAAELGRADVQPFPVPVGVEVGRGIDTFGRVLRSIDELAPQTAAIVGAGQASQQLEIHDATAGTYLLRQQVVRADGSGDVTPLDDARVTEIRLGAGDTFLHTTSRYDGEDPR